MRSVFFIIVFASLISCKNSFWYTNLYTRKSSKLKQFRENYKAVDNVQLGKLHLCYSYNRSRKQVVGNLQVETSQLIDSLLESYSRKFDHLNVSESAISIDGTRCLFDSKKSINALHQGTKSTIETPVKLYCQLSVIVASQRNLEGGGGLELTEDMGNDKHLLEYYLITALAQGESLLYIDNRVHWSEAFSERGEQLKYEVPQIVIDSLVTLSLEEYFKRVEP